MKKLEAKLLLTTYLELMAIINELKLSKDLIRFPSITPKDSGAIKFLSKKLKKLGFNCKILEFKDKKASL